MFFLNETASATARTTPQIDSIEDSIGYFHKLLTYLSDWFQGQQENLLNMLFGLILTLIAVVVVHYLFKFVFIRAAKRLPGNVIELVFGKISAPISVLVLVTGLSACNNMVNFPGNMDRWLSKFFYAAFILVFLWGIFRVIAIFSQYFRSRLDPASCQLNTLLIDLLQGAAKITVWVMAIIFIAQNLFNLNVTALVTGAGVAGLAVAFAAQNTIANLFGAISIITDKTFKVGDRITMNGVDGMVEAVGFRSTRVRALDGTIWNVPNRIAADGTIQNISCRPNIKYAFTLGLVYNTTPAQMRQALQILGEILDQRPEFDHENLPPRYFFTDYQAFSLDISVTLWFQTQDFIEFQQKKQAINLEILERFNAAGLEFAFPTSTNYIINQGAEK